MTERQRKLTFYSIIFLIIGGIVLFIIKHHDKIFRILLPFILAMIISYIAERPVNYIESKSFGKSGFKINRAYAIIIVYFIFILVIAAIMFFLIPSIIDNLKELIEALPDIYLRIEKIGKDVMEFLSALNVPNEITEVVKKEVEKNIYNLQNSGADTLSNIIASFGETVSIIFDCLLSFLIAFYFLRDAELIENSVLSIFPKKWRLGIAEVFSDINRIISSFISGQLLVAVIIGIIEIIGLSLIGVKYPVILGILGGLSNIIPVIGPFLGAIPATAFAILESPVKALIVIVFFIVVQQVDNNLITPKIVEGRLGLHPVVTIGVVLVGGILYGVLGMLFAVPITAILVSIAGKIVKAASKSSLEEG